jgi:hypothetical protein
MGAASQNLRRARASFRMRRPLAFCAAIFAWNAAMIDRVVGHLAQRVDRCGSPRDRRFPAMRPLFLRVSRGTTYDDCVRVSEPGE